MADTKQKEAKTTIDPLARFGLSGLVAPEVFTPSILREVPWIGGPLELRADGADDSGPMKAVRALRSLEWGALVLGGSVHLWRARRDSARSEAEQVTGRIERTERQGRDASALREHLATLEAEVARLDGLITAAEAWPGPDNVALRQRVEKAQIAISDCENRSEPYRTSPHARPRELDEAMLAAQRELAEAREAWRKGCEVFDAINEEVASTTASAHRALASALTNLCSRLGAEAAKLIKRGDRDLLKLFPDRGPDELLPLHARAVRINAMIETLAAAPLGIEAFMESAGPLAGTVIGAKARTAPALEPVEMTGRRGSAGVIMDRIY